MRDYPEATIAAGMCLFALILGAMISASELYSNHMRYQVFIVSQTNVLKCRAEVDPNVADRLCGPVPPMEDFK